MLRELAGLVSQPGWFPFYTLQVDPRAVRLRSDKAYNLTAHRPVKARKGRKRTARSASREQSPPRPRKCVPERKIITPGRTTRWPTRLQNNKPRGLYNPGNVCYRRALLQCLLNLPAMYNFLGTIHTRCEKPQEECTVCALQALMQKYWNDRTSTNFPDGDGGAVGTLDSAVRFCCPPNSGFHEFRTMNIQGDPHEFFTFLYDQLKANEHAL